MKLTLDIDTEAGTIQIEGLDQPVGFDADPKELEQLIKGIAALSQYPNARKLAFEFWSGAEFDLPDPIEDTMFDIGGWGVQCFDRECFTFKMG